MTVVAVLFTRAVNLNSLSFITYTVAVCRISSEVIALVASWSMPTFFLRWALRHSPAVRLMLIRTSNEGWRLSRIIAPMYSSCHAMAKSGGL